MNDSQSAVPERPAIVNSDLVAGSPPCQDLTDQLEEDRHVRRRRAEWQLLREKILFFYALLGLPALCLWAAWVDTGEQPARFKIAAGLFLVVAGSGLIHFLTGSSGRTVALIGALVRAWASHARAGPHQ